jgi:hypothetical protein
MRMPGTSQRPKKARKKTTSVSGAERAQRYREKMRAAGLRPVQMWVWDTSRPGFAEECRRQSLLLANDPHEKKILAEIEAMADTTGWK